MAHVLTRRPRQSWARSVAETGFDGRVGAIRPMNRIIIFLFTVLVVYRAAIDTEARAAEAAIVCLTAAESPIYTVGDKSDDQHWWNIISACHAMDRSRESKDGLTAADLVALRARAYWELGDTTLARQLFTR